MWRGHIVAFTPEGPKNVGIEQFLNTHLLHLMSGSQVKFIQNKPFQSPWILSCVVIIVVIIITKAKDKVWLMSEYRNKITECSLEIQPERQLMQAGGKRTKILQYADRLYSQITRKPAEL